MKKQKITNNKIETLNGYIDRAIQIRKELQEISLGICAIQGTTIEDFADGLEIDSQIGYYITSISACVLTDLIIEEISNKYNLHDFVSKN